MTILQYCSVCKAEYEMTVVPTADGDDDGVVWLQCPSCKGFLPKVSSSIAFQGTEDAAEETAEASGPESGDAPEKIAAEASAEAAPPAETGTDPEDDPVVDGDEAIDAVDPLADMDVSLAVAYRPWSTYAEGDVIHHLAWDDFGVVVAKETLPGNRKVVQVKFAEAGVVRLIEQEGDGP